MNRISYEKINKSVLITLPDEYRNQVWGLDFGAIQDDLQSLHDVNHIEVNASHCVWIDPLPMLSLIIELQKLPETLTKRFYIRDEAERNLDQLRVLSFLEKEGFLEALTQAGVQIYIKYSDGKERLFDDTDRKQFIEFENYLRYLDSTILTARVLNLSEYIKDSSTEDFVDATLESIGFKLSSRISANVEAEVYNKIGLFLKETLDNIYEHAYLGSHEPKYAGLYIRYRKGLADNSIDAETRRELKKVIDKEHHASPTLRRQFIDNVNSFLEIFVIDSGIGLTRILMVKTSPRMVSGPHGEIQ